MRCLSVQCDVIRFEYSESWIVWFTWHTRLNWTYAIQLITVDSTLTYAHTPKRCLWLADSSLILLPKVLISSLLSRSLALTLGLAAVRMPSKCCSQAQATWRFHTFSFWVTRASPQCLPMDRIQRGNIMDVIYLAILVPFVKCPWVAQDGPQEIHWPLGSTNPQFSRFPISLESLVLTIPCSHRFFVFSSCHGSTQVKTAHWTVISSYMCSCGTTQCQGCFSSLECTSCWLVSGPIKGDVPRPSTHLESWDLPVNLGSYHPTRCSRQWRRI